MVDFLPGCLPHVLLRVEVWSCHGEVLDLQSRVGGPDIPDWLPTMPRSAVPEEQDGHIRNRGEDIFQVLRAGHRVHGFCARDDLLAGVQVQGAVEVRAGAAGIAANNRCLAAWRPDRLQGRLQIK